MNKKYFSFLPSLSKDNIPFISLCLITSVTLIWFIQAMLSRADGTKALVLLIVTEFTLLIFIAVLSLFAKITGISWLRGVDYIGRYTLISFDYLFMWIQKARGIEVTKKNRYIMPSDKKIPVVEKKSSVIHYSTEQSTKIDHQPKKDILFDNLGNQDKSASFFSQLMTFEKKETGIEKDIDIDIGMDKEPLENDLLEDDLDLLIEDDLDLSFLALDEALEEQQKNHVLEPILTIEPTEKSVESENPEQLNTFFEEKQEKQPIESIADMTIEPNIEPQIDIIPEITIEPIKLDELIIPSDLKVNSEPIEPKSIENNSVEVNGLKVTEPSDESTLEEAIKHVEAYVDDLELPENNAEDVLPVHDSVLSKPYIANFEPTEEALNIEDELEPEKEPENILVKVELSPPPPPPIPYQLPDPDLLTLRPKSTEGYSEEELYNLSRSVERVLQDYKISAEVMGAYPGPIITLFELNLAPGLKVSRVTGLAKDLARTLLVASVRVVEIIEGTSYVGLEIPNKNRELVSFHEIISSERFQQAKSPLSLALGKDVAGQVVVSDLSKMPHVLVAGTTGSGKSVAINTMILSMLYKGTPEQVRMIMIDPKMLELSVYEGIPHLLSPVVTDMKEAQNALRWAVAEMERRYKLMSKVGVRNLAGFNQLIEDAEARGEAIRDPLCELVEPLTEGQTFPVLTTLPSIVVVIDELADMMMIVGKKVEELIARLAQKARAAGIHLILATQRPSVDVLTGLIKANIPTRISFQVSSRIDSRTILDQGGSESLLGNGDMLFLPSGRNIPLRAHGAFVDDDEVHRVVDHLKAMRTADYLTGVTEEVTPEVGSSESGESVDPLYTEAVNFVIDTGKASISSVQRRFKVGYNRAARMIDQMEEENIVTAPEGNGSRQLVRKE